MVCEHEACPHAAVDFKERSWWERRTKQKRSVLENVPPWRTGEGWAFMGVGEWKPQMPGRQKKALAGMLGLTPIPGPLCL